MSTKPNKKNTQKVRKFLSTTKEQRALGELINKENKALIKEEKKPHPINELVSDSSYQMSSVLQVLKKDNKVHHDVTIGRNFNDIQ
jgi:hypothetical protein